MIPSYYYHGLMKKYVVYFGTLFNDISIERTDENNRVIQDFLVPISYGPKQRFIARLEQDPTLNKETALTLPRMSFEVVDFEYDPQRKLPTMNTFINQNTIYDNKMDTTFAPVPYNIKFALVIYSKNAEDGFKIMEQILPYFTPEWTSTLNLIPELDLKVDVPVVLDDLTMSDRYEGQMEAINRRYIFHTLQFVMKGYFFGPVTKGGLIKRAIANLYNSTLNRSANLNIVSYITDFQKGNEVYQLLGSERTASGIVRTGNSTFLQLSNVLGKFSTAKNLLCANSNAIGEIISITSSDTPTEVVTVRPTMTANGEPTTDIDLSVDIDQISSTDNFGINVTISSN